MKKIISIILAIVICIVGCFMFTACSNEEDLLKISVQEEYIKESKIEVARSSFSAVMDSLNGFIIIEDECPLEIDLDTTIQQVMDAVENVTVDHIDTSERFLDYCEWVDPGYYSLKSTNGVDWLELYEE